MSEQTQVHQDNNIKLAIEDLGRTFEEFKKQHAEMLKQEVQGHVDPLLKEHVSRLNNAVTLAEEAKLAAENAQKLAKRTSAVDTSVDFKAMEKLSAAYFMYKGQKLECDDVGKLKEAFNAYFRLNRHRTPLVEHQLAMSSWSDPEGGYFILPEMDNEITRPIWETTPILNYARVINISTNEYKKPNNLDLAGAYWADREMDIEKTPTQTYGMLSIPVHKLVAEPVIPEDLINDAIINIEQEVASSVSTKMSLLLNESFVTGNGVGQPRGFLDYPEGTNWGQIERINSGEAANISADLIINMETALKNGYRNGAIYAANRRTVGALRLLKDGQGNYLWQPSYQAGTPSTINGYPLVQFEDMPDIGAGALPIVFANFRAAYTIVRRSGTVITVNPYQKSGWISYYTRQRWGGGVENFEAIKLAKISNA